MKRFWLVLLSLGLVMAFSVSAFAVDVKVSAEFYAAGLMLNKTTVADVATNPSTAFYFQRLRMGTDFVVSPCLKLVTRFDAMERIWGGARGSGSGSSSILGSDAESAGTRTESQNIAFDLLYVEYTSPVGLFKVGYQKDYEWGTVFGDRTSGPPSGQIQYLVPVGPVILFAGLAKEGDGSASAVTTGVTTTDQDYDSYRLAAIYNFNTSQVKGETGALLLFNRFAGAKAAGIFPYLQNVYVIDPYFKAQIGPVALQGELQYWFGDAARWEDGGLGPFGKGNVSISAWSVFLDATVNLGMVYVGGSFAYLSGDDPGTNDIEGGVNTGGLDWNPCLIMFNTIDTAYWVGNLAGNSGSSVDGEMSNAYFFQGRVGVKPVPKLDAMLSISYATADKKPASYLNSSYGWEIDATGTYKITNNLSYMLGIGYFFTGDYYKGTATANTTVDDYMLINKLTLSF